MIPSNLKSLLENRKKFVDENADISLGQGTSLSSDIINSTDDKKSKKAHFGPKSATGYTGLVNQGATCYLNSLMQTLFMVPEFRHAIYNWDYDAVIHGEELYCLTRQLQLLFVNLQFSIQSSISTISLTRSFGWTAADSFSQQDVQECMMIIFDFILSQCQNSDLPHLVFQLMYSHIKNNLTCLNCHVTRGGFDTQRDIQLQVRGFSSLEESLDNYIHEEVLEGIFCDHCQAKHSHSKGVLFASLPTILTLQLKRFDMDYNTFQRIKVNDCFTIPETIDMGRYTQTTEPAIYDLTAVLVHVGNAFSGHYFCYLKEIHSLSYNNSRSNNDNSSSSNDSNSSGNNNDDYDYSDSNNDSNSISSRGSWLLFNDSTVTSLSSTDLDTVFSKPSTSNNNNLSTNSLTPSSSTNKATIPKNNSSIVPIASYAYMILYRKRVSDQPLPSDLVTDISMLPEDIRLRVQQENDSFLRMKREREEALSFIHSKIRFGKLLQCFKIHQSKTIRDLINVAYEYFTSQQDSQDSKLSLLPPCQLANKVTTSNMTTTSATTTTDAREEDINNSCSSASSELSLYVEDALQGTADKLLGEDTAVLSTLPSGIFERTLLLVSRPRLRESSRLDNEEAVTETETVPLYLVFVLDWTRRSNSSNAKDLLGSDGSSSSSNNSSQHTCDAFVSSSPVFSPPEPFLLPVTFTVTEMIQWISVRYNTRKTDAMDKTDAGPSIESSETIAVCCLHSSDGTAREVLPSSEAACLALTSGDTLYIDGVTFSHGSDRNNLLTYFNTLKYTITVSFGFIDDASAHPSSSPPPQDTSSLRREISFDKRLPMSALKERIAAALSLSPDSLSSFRLFMGCNGPEVKDMQQTAESLGLADGSFLQLRYGTPLSPGMYSLRIFLQGNNGSPLATTTTQEPYVGNSSSTTSSSQNPQSSPPPLSEVNSTSSQTAENIRYFEVTVDEKDAVADLKSRLLQLHRDDLGIAADDPSPNIRLRRCERSAVTGTLKPTTALRDRQTLRVAVPALADGTYVMVQTYVQESLLLEDHVLVDIRYWSAEKEETESEVETLRRLPGAEVALLKTMLFSELKHWILSTNLFPLNETDASGLTAENLIFVKPFSWQLKGRRVLADMMQLKWLATRQPGDADPLYGPPFRLCDGSILLVADRRKVSALLLLLDDSNDPILHHEATAHPVAAAASSLREETGFRLFTPSQQAARRAAEAKETAETKQVLEARMKLVYDRKLTKSVNSSDI